jgi:hypothetical protein
MLVLKILQLVQIVQWELNVCLDIIKNQIHLVFNVHHHQKDVLQQLYSKVVLILIIQLLLQVMMYHVLNVQLQEML